MVEAALLKLMRRNHDAGLVYTSQEGKDANYFQLFFYITAFYSLSLDAPNYNQNYHSSFAQLFSYYSYVAAKYLETLSRIMRYMPRLCFLKGRSWDSLLQHKVISETVWFHQPLIWQHQITQCQLKLILFQMKGKVYKENLEKNKSKKIIVYTFKRILSYKIFT